MGVGCDETGICYAAAHGEPEHCPLATPLSKVLQSQLDKLRQKYPDATIGGPNENGDRLLSVPGVVLPKFWQPRKTTVYVIIPMGYPMSQPLCFYTPQDVRLNGGGVPTNTVFDGSCYGGKLAEGLMWWHWKICRDERSTTLVQYVNAMRRRFSVQR
jgi:hypothetical protein